MLAFRYAALAALVVWLGVTLTTLAGEVLGGIADRPHLIGLGCGAIVIVSLFVLKFVGPPPRAFTVRAALAFLMVAVSFYAERVSPQSPVLLGTIALIGFILLFWYSNE